MGTADIGPVAVLRLRRPDRRAVQQPGGWLSAAHQQPWPRPRRRHQRHLRHQLSPRRADAPALVAGLRRFPAQRDQQPRSARARSHAPRTAAPGLGRPARHRSGTAPRCTPSTAARCGRARRPERLRRDRSAATAVPRQHLRHRRLRDLRLRPGDRADRPADRRRRARREWPTVTASGEVVWLGTGAYPGATSATWDREIFRAVPSGDADGDGVPDASDNCPLRANADQADSGGSELGVADGIGDACQCGDASNDGVVDGTDARARSALAAGSWAALARPGSARVNGAWAPCSVLDVARAAPRARAVRPARSWDRADL